MPKIEMGQGIYTALSMLLAEELEVSLSQVIVRHSPPDAMLYGGAAREQSTGGSTAIRTLWQPLREAGACARQMLQQAAAMRWAVEPVVCRAEHGRIVHTDSGRSLSYGELAKDAAGLPLPTKVALKPASQFRLIGTAQKRVDGPAKVDGSAKFGIDVVLTGMHFAAVAASPVLGGKLRNVDGVKALALPGVRQIVRLDNAVAVVADSTWAARQGLAALSVDWDGGANATLSTADIATVMERAAATPGKLGRNDGNAAATLAADAARIESTYINPMLAHAAMEPLNCTVHVRVDGAEVWAGSQVPARARDAVARTLGLAPAQVQFHGFLLGGAFGRRLHTDFIEQAAQIGRHVEGPVKVTWSREEDIQHDAFRGLYHHQLAASLDASGIPVAWHHKVAGPSNIRQFAPGRLVDGLDRANLEGSENLPYDITNLRAEYVLEDGPIFTGFWRGVGPTRNAFAIESFIDELALRAKRDPLAYRLAMLGKQPRARKVLEVAANKAGWGRTLPPRSGRGIALLGNWNTWMAQVVELKVADDGAITVERVVCAVDCGVVVNPDTVVAQIEGGINFGLSAMLYGDITIKDGRVEQSNFHDYEVMRMQACPRIEVEIIASSEAPGGIGEPGTAVVGPAFANAVYAATNVRLYTVPAKSGQLNNPSAKLGSAA